MKQIETLLKINRILYNQQNEIDDIFAEVIELIPELLLCEKAYTRIFYKDNVFQSKKYKSKGIKILSEISVNTKNFGSIETYLLNDQDDTKEIIKEHQQLLDILAKEIAVFIDDRFMKQQVDYCKVQLLELFDNIEDLLIVLDKDGKIITANKNIKVRLLYSESELKGRNITDFFCEDSSEKINLIISNNLENNFPKFNSSLIAKDNSQIPVETKIAKIAWNGSNQLIAISRDIREQVLAEKKQEESFFLLRKNLGGIIQAAAQAVEVRDAYTAGHQRRVANLARLIAEEMGLAKYQIEGIRTAASIHDIGKIAIPADILSKSTPLLDIEYELVKRHANVGFQILKTIDFPWPVAAIVYQHHEKIDGSGYPLGLTGDMMLIEAKVLAVADVVEAMATHRPYRPALGIEKAMHEIKIMRGILYDEEVADACLSLFSRGKLEIYDGIGWVRPF